MKRDPFFIIGAQRSGTTKLAHLLDAHPEIRIAKPMWPEPKLFLEEEKLPRSPEEYLSRLFPDAGSQEVLGEKSTTYIEFPEAGKRIQELFPEAHILVMLRDPVERALSNYRFSKKNGLETRSMREVFLEEKAPPKLSKTLSTDPFLYLERSDYLHYLKAWADIFPWERIDVLINEEFFADPKHLKGLYRALGVDDAFNPEEALEERQNVSEGEGTDPEVLEKLREHFAPKIQALEEFLGRDLGGWKR